MARLTFTDYEAYAEMVREASVTMRMCSLEEPLWTLRHAVVGPLSIQHGFEGGGSIAEGATTGEGWTFYHQSHPGLTNGQAATGQDVFVAPPGADFCLVCKPRHAWLTVHFPTALLFPSSHDLDLASRARAQLLKPPPHVTRRFTSLILRFLSYAESAPHVSESPSAVDSFRMELLAAAREILASSQYSDSRHFVRWRDQAKASTHLAMRHADDSLSVPELARQIGVPERTLRTAFRRCYGVSPLRWLRLHRLHQARRILLASCPDATTVTQIAVGLGFWDLGRFAGAYRQLFRERPSETLRRPATNRRPI